MIEAEFLNPKVVAIVAVIMTFIGVLCFKFFPRFRKEEKKISGETLGDIFDETTEVMDEDELKQKQQEVARRVMESESSGELLAAQKQWRLALDDNLWNLIAEYSQKYKIEQAVLAGLIMQESAGNTFAMRYEPTWPYSFDVDKWAKKVGSSQATEEQMQKSSFGLCQVMGTVAREKGHKTWLSELFNPAIGIHYGAMILKEKLDKYGSLDDALSAYNHGSPWKDSAGHGFKNQDYVDGVKKHADALWRQRTS